MAGRRVRPVRADVTAGVAELVPDPDSSTAWLLAVDGTPQSHVDLADPLRLEFEYVRWIARLIDAMAPAGERLSVLHLGGGAWTLPRYVAATRPGSDQRVVELDAGLVEFVREHLPLPPRSGVRVRVADAREVLTTVRAASFDLVVLDCFTGAQVPAHLTSRECFELAAAALRPGGFLAVNVADGSQLRFTRAEAATVAGVFPEAALISTPLVMRGRRFGNVVLIGSPGGSVPPDLARSLLIDPVPARLRDRAQLTAFVAGAAPITDATAAASPAPPPGWLSDLAR
ncbi:spermidine synthase [Spongisporangium articulatum]|uniref:Spermidine synthase n=1 Tax=Spongisporangium articulatum TaxID=3362603 RepID=A0ABW8ALL7_9ACTN